MPFKNLIQHTIPSIQQDFGSFKCFVMSETLKVGYFFHEKTLYAIFYY